MITLKATAAATSTVPLSPFASVDCAFGVDVFPESFAGTVALFEVSLPSFSCASPLSLTLPCVSVLLPAAPFAPAVAALAEADEPNALNLTSPSAVRFRSSDESTR